jgi:hypothetical protein
MTNENSLKTPVRIILTFIAITSSFNSILFVPLFLLPWLNIKKPFNVLLALILAAGIGVFLWKKTGSISDSQAKYILLGGIIVGAIGFISGFIGPIIFNPSANQGPLLGIFITGPLGFLVGLIGGGIYGLIKKNKLKMKK